MRRERPPSVPGRWTAKRRQGEIKARSNPITGPNTDSADEMRTAIFSRLAPTTASERGPAPPGFTAVMRGLCGASDRRARCGGSTEGSPFFPQGA